jgi:hypothetical protein
MTNRFNENFNSIMNNVSTPSKTSRKNSQRPMAGAGSVHITPTSPRLKPASQRPGITEVEVAKDAQPGTRTPCSPMLAQKILNYYNMQNLGQLGNSNVKLIKLGDGYILLTT